MNLDSAETPGTRWLHVNSTVEWAVWSVCEQMKAKGFYHRGKLFLFFLFYIFPYLTKPIDPLRFSAGVHDTSMDAEPWDRSGRAAEGCFVINKEAKAGAIVWPTLHNPHNHHIGANGKYRSTGLTSEVRKTGRERKFPCRTRSVWLCCCSACPATRRLLRLLKMRHEAELQRFAASSVMRYEQEISNADEKRKNGIVGYHI